MTGDTNAGTQEQTLPSHESGGSSRKYSPSSTVPPDNDQWAGSWRHGQLQQGSFRRTVVAKSRCGARASRTVPPGQAGRGVTAIPVAAPELPVGHDSRGGRWRGRDEVASERGYGRAALANIESCRKKIPRSLGSLQMFHRRLSTPRSPAVCGSLIRWQGRPLCC